MTASVLQSAVQDTVPASGNTSATSTSKALPGNTTAGSSLLVFFTYSSGSTLTVTVSDDRNAGNWTLFSQQVDTGAQTVVGMAYRDGVVGGSIPTVTVSTGASSVPYRALKFYEIGGTSGFDKGASNFQTAPTTAPDAVLTPATATLAGQPALAVCAGMNTLNIFTPNSGTGFTNDGTAFQWEFSVPFCRFETKYLTATTGIAATFTATNNDPHASFIAVFREAAGGSLLDVDGGTDTPAVTDSCLRTTSFGRVLSDIVTSISDTVATSGLPKDVVAGKYQFLS